MYLINDAQFFNTLHYDKWVVSRVIVIVFID